MDFTNALNYIQLDKLLSQVSDLVPQLLLSVHSAYGTPSTLCWDATTLQTAESVQQGILWASSVLSHHPSIRG